MVNSGSFDAAGSEGESAKAEFTQLEDGDAVLRSAASPRHLAEFAAVVPDAAEANNSADAPTLAPERDDGLSHQDMTTLNTKCEPVKTSLQCSVPLDKVKNVLELCRQPHTHPPDKSKLSNLYILENYLKQKQTMSTSTEHCSSTSIVSPIDTDAPTEVSTDLSPSSSRPALKRLLCLFCERTFTSNSLRQKHVDRCHSAGQTRRSSSRTSSHSPSVTACCFCSKLNNTKHTLKQLLEHLVMDHSNRYFACVTCQERFTSIQSFRDHNKSIHNIQEVDIKPLQSLRIPDTSSQDPENITDKEMHVQTTEIPQTHLKRTNSTEVIKSDSDLVSTVAAQKFSPSNSVTPSSKQLRRTSSIKSILSEKKKSDKREFETSEKSSELHVDFEDSIMTNIITPADETKPQKNSETKPEETTVLRKLTRSSVAKDKNFAKKNNNGATKKISVKSTKNGVRNLRTTRATVKLLNSFNKTRKSKLVKSETTDADKIVEFKKPKITSTSVFSLVNAYTYKYEKIYDHASDSIKDANSVQFNAVFDKEFYCKTVCNIRDNLMHHLDGKLNRNIESESRISNFEHNPASVPETDAKSTSDSYGNFGCDLSLNAVTPVATLLASSQYGEDFDAQIEYGAKASQKKAKKVAVVKYKFPNKKYNSLFRDRSTHTDLTCLDIWTQFTVKERQHKCHDDDNFDSDSIYFERPTSTEAKHQVDELNTILDTRGPFEDLRLEADAAQFFELRKKNFKDGDHISEEASKDVYFILEDLLNRVMVTCNNEHKIKSETITNSNLNATNTEDNLVLPHYLGLQPSSDNKNNFEIDKTDKIALICSSQDPNVQSPKKLELTGEWTRPRLYICAACGFKLPNIKLMEEHKNSNHPHIWCSHYEFVGSLSQTYRHLSIPGLGKVGRVEMQPLNRLWQKSDARICTKCTKQCHNLGELHKHILECGGDWTWMLARKKCKYRPYGARSRRRRQRGYKRSCNPEVSRVKPKIKSAFIGPRPKPSKPSDAETIKRMLENLPAKRNRKMISMRDGVQRPRKQLMSPHPSQPPKSTAIKSSTKNFHYKNAPQITKQTLRSALNRKVVINNMRKQKNDNNDITSKLRSRVNKENTAENTEKENETTKEEDLSTQLMGTKSKIRNKRMISRILGSKIFDSNSALITRRRLVKAITQSNLIRRTRLRTKMFDNVNLEFSNDTDKLEKNVDKISEKVNQVNKIAEDGKRNSQRNQNNEDISKDTKLENVDSKLTNDVEKTTKKSNSKRLLSVFGKSNKKPKTSVTTTETSKIITVEKTNTINATIEEVISKAIREELPIKKDKLVENVSEAKKDLINNKLSKNVIYKNSPETSNKDKQLSNTEDDNNIKSVNAVHKKPEKLGKIIEKNASKIVRNVKSFKNALKKPKTEGKEGIGSKLIRSLSIRKSKAKKKKNDNITAINKTETDVKIVENEYKKTTTDDESNDLNTITTEVTNNEDIVKVTLSEETPIKEDLADATTPVIEESASLILDKTPDLNSVKEDSITSSVKLSDNIAETPAMEQSDDIKTQSENSANTLNKLKCKMKRSGRGLNDCIAMLKCKLEQKTSEPSLVDKSNLFILNSTETNKPVEPVVEKSCVHLEETSLEVRPVETKLNNEINVSLVKKSTVLIEDKLDEPVDQPVENLIIKNVLEVPTLNNRKEENTKATSNTEVSTVEIETQTADEDLAEAIDADFMPSAIHSSFDLSYVLNATLKNCLMECVKNKCETFKIENQNYSLKPRGISKDRKIGSIRKRRNNKPIDKPVEMHIPNVPVLLNTAFISNPFNSEPNIQSFDEVSDDDVPLSNFITNESYNKKIKVKLPAKKKKHSSKKPIAFTPLILNNQDSFVPQINLQKVGEENSLNSKIETAQELTEEITESNITTEDNENIQTTVTVTQKEESSSIENIAYNSINNMSDLHVDKVQEVCTTEINQDNEELPSDIKAVQSEILSQDCNTLECKSTLLLNEKEPTVVPEKELPEIPLLSQMFGIMEDEPLDNDLINKSLIEPNNESTSVIKQTNQDTVPESIECKVDYLDSGKENTEEKTPNAQVKRQRRSVKKSKIKRMSKLKSNSLNEGCNDENIQMNVTHNEETLLKVEPAKKKITRIKSKIVPPQVDSILESNINELDSSSKSNEFTTTKDKKEIKRKSGSLAKKNTIVSEEEIVEDTILQHNQEEKNVVLQNDTEEILNNELQIIESPSGCTDAVIIEPTTSLDFKETPSDSIETLSDSIETPLESIQTPSLGSRETSLLESTETSLVDFKETSLLDSSETENNTEEECIIEKNDSINILIENTENVTVEKTQNDASVDTQFIPENEVPLQTAISVKKKHKSRSRTKINKADIERENSTELLEKAEDIVDNHQENIIENAVPISDLLVSNNSKHKRKSRSKTKDKLDFEHKTTEELFEQRKLWLINQDNVIESVIRNEETSVDHFQQRQINQDNVIESVIRNEEISSTADHIQQRRITRSKNRVKDISCESPQSLDKTTNIISESTCALSLANIIPADILTEQEKDTQDVSEMEAKIISNELCNDLHNPELNNSNQIDSNNDNKKIDICIIETDLIDESVTNTNVLQAFSLIKEEQSPNNKIETQIEEQTEIVKEDIVQKSSKKRKSRGSKKLAVVEVNENKEEYFVQNIKTVDNELSESTDETIKSIDLEINKFNPKINKNADFATLEDTTEELRNEEAEVVVIKKGRKKKTSRHKMNASNIDKVVTSLSQTTNDNNISHELNNLIISNKEIINLNNKNELSEPMTLTINQIIESNDLTADEVVDIDNTFSDKAPVLEEPVVVNAINEKKKKKSLKIKENNSLVDELSIDNEPILDKPAAVKIVNEKKKKKSLKIKENFQTNNAVDIFEKSENNSPIQELSIDNEEIEKNRLQTIKTNQAENTVCPQTEEKNINSDSSINTSENNICFKESKILEETFMKDDVVLPVDNTQDKSNENDANLIAPDLQMVKKKKVRKSRSTGLMILAKDSMAYGDEPETIEKLQDTTINNLGTEKKKRRSRSNRSEKMNIGNISAENTNLNAIQKKNETTLIDNNDQLTKLNVPVPEVIETTVPFKFPHHESELLNHSEKRKNKKSRTAKQPIKLKIIPPVNNLAPVMTNVNLEAEREFKRCARMRSKINYAEVETDVSLDAPTTEEPSVALESHELYKETIENLQRAKSKITLKITLDSINIKTIEEPITETLKEENELSKLTNEKKKRRKSKNYVLDTPDTEIPALKSSVNEKKRRRRSTKSKEVLKDVTVGNDNMDNVDKSSNEHLENTEITLDIDEDKPLLEIASELNAPFKTSEILFNFIETESENKEIEAKTTNINTDFINENDAAKDAECLVSNFKFNLQMNIENEPDNILMENKDIPEIMPDLSTLIEDVLPSTQLSDSEDEIPLAALAKGKKIQDAGIVATDRNNDCTDLISVPNDLKELDVSALALGFKNNAIDVSEISVNSILKDIENTEKDLNKENSQLTLQCSSFDFEDDNVINQEELSQFVNITNQTLLENIEKEDQLMYNLNDENMPKNKTCLNSVDIAKIPVVEEQEAIDQTVDNTLKVNENIDQITTTPIIEQSPERVSKTEGIISFLNTPTEVKTVTCESDFITTPDLADTSLVIKIKNALKVKMRKPKKNRRRVNKNAIKRKEEEELSTINCEICNKVFKHKESLTSHKRTLTHIAKLSEIEARENLVNKTSVDDTELNENSLTEVTEQCNGKNQCVKNIENIESSNNIKNISSEIINEDANISKAYDIDKIDAVDYIETIDNETNEGPQLPENSIEHLVDNSEVNELSEGDITEPVKELLGIEPQNNVTNFMPGLINSANNTLKLIDIINEVLDKPVNDKNYSPRSIHKSPVSCDSTETYMEPKRYKSLGERKSFDSDNYNLPSKNSDDRASTEGFSTSLKPISNGEILCKQLSILENIIEETNPTLKNYIDDSISLSSNPFEDPISNPTIFEEKSKPEDNLSNLVKPTNHFHNFENISETFTKPVKQRNEEESKDVRDESTNKKKCSKENTTRKILNRDEELFVECCSLLKSGSEISGVSKKSTKQIPLNNFSRSNDSTWIIQKQQNSDRFIQRDSYSWLAQTSRVETPIGEPFSNNDWSNSNSAVSSEWLAQKAPSPDRPIESGTVNKKSNNNSGEIKYSDIQFEDISIASSLDTSKTLMAADNLNTENIRLDFHHIDFSNTNFNNEPTERRDFINDEPQFNTNSVRDIDDDIENINDTESCKNTEKDDYSIPLAKNEEDDVSSKEEYDPEFKKKMVTAFGGLMAKALSKRLQAVVKKTKKSRCKRDFTNALQASITDYAVPVKKNKLNQTDSDSNDCPKKMRTKGAMKIFEGLKVSIPTQDLNLKEVLNCSTKGKKEQNEEQLVKENNEILNTETDVVEEKAGPKNGTIKNILKRFGNKLGLREKKKKNSKRRSPKSKNRSNNKSSTHDVYAFEESIDTNVVSNSNAFSVFKPNRKPESQQTDGKNVQEQSSDDKNKLDNWNAETDDSDTDRYYDSMSFEEMSVSSESINENNAEVKSKPIPKKNSEKTKDNQKKFMIMGRIFKNASKPKLEDKIPEIRDISSEENSKLVENYLDICNSVEKVVNDHSASTEISTVPNNPATTNNANKLSKKEMDMLFDKLLEEEKKLEKLQNETQTAVVEKEIINNDAVFNKPLTIEKHIFDKRKLKDGKLKIANKTKKRQRHNSDSASSDEFRLGSKQTKSSKKHHKTHRKSTKSKKETAINLEQEIKECIGVAGRKSQRKCTSGKQNILAEFWSSDESSFEEIINLSESQNINRTPKSIQTEGQSKELINSDSNSPTPEGLTSRKEDKKQNNLDIYDFESDLDSHIEEYHTKSKSEQNKDDSSCENKLKLPKKISKPKRCRKQSKNLEEENEEDTEYEIECNRRRTESKHRKIVESDRVVSMLPTGEQSMIDSLAVSRKKRNAGEQLYYWSSSSDDEFQDLIEVKPIREDTEDDRPMQHGWIVGDSPKKLVTMLAQAKGKKIDGETVKEQNNKKNRVTL